MVEKSCGTIQTMEGQFLSLPLTMYPRCWMAYFTLLSKLINSYDAPQILQETQRWVLEWNNGKKKKLEPCSLIRNILGVGGHARAPGWD